MAHLDSFTSLLIWPYPWVVAANFKRVLTRIYWKVCRALARVLAPPPSRLLVRFLLAMEWVFSFFFCWLLSFGCMGWVDSGSVCESRVAYVLGNFWLGLLTFGCSGVHGGDWRCVYLQSGSFSLLVVAAWSFFLVVAARFYVFYFMYSMFNVGFWLNVGVIPLCGLYAFTWAKCLVVDF
ncbi:unnamed protein product [Prunus brigantina]